MTPVFYVRFDIGGEPAGMAVQAQVAGRDTFTRLTAVRTGLERNSWQKA
jgi:hypothetical protein